MEQVITIRDSGPRTPTLSIGDVSVEEDDGPATVTVRLNPASNQTVTVNFATSDGTATAGSDYSRSPGTLTFVVGDTEETISVPSSTTTSSRAPSSSGSRSAALPATP